MNFLKMLIGLPVLAVLLVFAFVNNDFATFSIWPFSFEVTISLSIAVILLFVSGFVFGYLFAWLGYMPELRQQRKQNKKLNKAHNKLVEQFSDLQENLETIKKEDHSSEAKPSLKSRLKNVFKRKGTSQIT